jgi:hypothetical protein
VSEDDTQRTRNGKRGEGATTRLPPRVERALEAARAAAKADRERKGGRWLAMVPVTVCVLLLLVMMPRATEPDSIPLPRVDDRTLARIRRSDNARAAAAEAERLPSDVLAVGTAFRGVNRSEVSGADEVEKIDAKRHLENAVRDLVRRESLEDELLSLRAVQARRFVDAIVRWEVAGETTEDLVELGGNFLDRIREAGWIDGRRVLFSEAQERVAFKIVWNAMTGLERSAAFALTLDEQRTLYAFYIQHPRVPESHRLALDAQRRAATTAESCARSDAEEARQKEVWLTEKLKKLGTLDVTYPTAYALGVAYYRAGRLDLSADAFNTFLEQRPDGPLTLRARNHLKAVLAGSL